MRLREIAYGLLNGEPISLTRNRLTPETIAAMRAAQARVAPHLPPLMAQGLWIARINGD